MNKNRESRFLLVKGCAGIGNRLYTLAAAIKYAVKTNRQLIVDWSDGVFAEPGKDAFTVFFKLEGVSTCSLKEILHKQENYSFYPASIKGRAEEKLYDLFVHGHSDFFSRVPGSGRLSGKLSRLTHYWHFSPGDNFNKSINSPVKSFASVFSPNNVEHGNKLSSKLNEDVVMFADYWPSNVHASDFKNIMFRSELIKEVEDIQHRLNISENSCGVHIRFTDKKPEKELSSLIRILKKENSVGKSIFLSTDNEAIEKQFRSELGTNLITFPKFYPGRQENENMHHWSLKSSNYSKAELIYKESLIDLLLLASCGTLYYQGNSSFSKLAVILKKTKTPSMDWLKIDGV